MYTKWNLSKMLLSIKYVYDNNAVIHGKYILTTKVGQNLMNLLIRFFIVLVLPFCYDRFFQEQKQIKIDKAIQNQYKMTT